MGRRALYLTPEEKRDANRAKSKRSYERHQAATNERRRARYQPKVRVATSATATNINGSLSNVSDLVPGVAYCTERVQHIQKNIQILLDDRPPPLYINALRHDYMVGRDTRYVQEAILDMRRHQARVFRHLDNLLQLVGPQSDMWKEADIVRQKAGLIIGGLEDLEMHMMMGFDELKASYKAGTLLYQTW